MAIDNLPVLYDLFKKYRILKTGKAGLEMNLPFLFISLVILNSQIIFLLKISRLSGESDHYLF